MARSGVAGSLSLGFLSSMERVLGDVVRRFSVAHPNLSLGLEHPSMQAFNEGIRSGQLDAGVTFSFGLEPFEGLRQHRLCQEEVAAILPIGHPLSERPHLHISDLKGFPMVAMSPSESGTLAHAWISERFQRRGFSPDIVRRTSNFETLLFLIESGLGIGFLTRQSVEYYSHFKLLARPLEDEDLEVDVVLAWRSDNRNPALPLFLREFGIENLHAFMDKLH
nr:LysR family substrate-binding domain-containing protein [uncultured Holophaga sp.]